jgi:hypothetical protein
MLLDSARATLELDFSRSSLPAVLLDSPGLKARALAERSQQNRDRVRKPI